MKNTTRRFITASLLCVALIVTLVTPSSSQGQGVISISSQAGLGPVNATPGFVTDTTYALLHGLSAYGLWQSIPNGSAVNVTNIFSSANVGKAMYSALAVTSSVPFTLGGIFSTQSSPFFNFSGTLGSDGLTYTKFGIGVAADGTTYTAGNANTLVNAVYIIGYGYSIDITGSTMEQALNTWIGQTPFTEQVSYTVNGSTASTSINYITAVPEPSTSAIGIIGGALGLVQIMRRKK
ncbi:MAG: hypothetical protein PHG25_02260 [Candidatus Pacebacteria bacterium]|nr:hypothetical protein [Candidatus Paceibacterota bacterium]